jgi:prepilin-type N-terminal cleavage/methylation domain-containing protein
MIQMKKLNNKGFSLVELIIVIAIMAILVGVVGTQVIPYLENSRKAKDIQVLSAWNTAGMSAYSAAAAKVNSGADYTITITSTDVTCGSTVTDDAGAEVIRRNFCDLTGLYGASDTKPSGAVAGYPYTTKMESKAGTYISSVAVKIESNGTITTTTTMDNRSGYKSTYAFDPIENK